MHAQAAGSHLQHITVPLGFKTHARTYTHNFRVSKMCFLGVIFMDFFTFPLNYGCKVTTFSFLSSPVV